jgi:hypothetical protein
MKTKRRTVLTVAAMVTDPAAMNVAALAGDFDGKADTGLHQALLVAAAWAVHVLGRVGAVPRSGYGYGDHHAASG